MQQPITVVIFMFGWAEPVDTSSGVPKGRSQISIDTDFRLARTSKPSDAKKRQVAVQSR